MTLPDWPATLASVVRGEALDDDTAADTMDAVMRGDVSPVRIAALLVGLRAKGETVEEVAGFVRSMRAFSLPLDAPEGALDTCGTGGDRAGTFNISTVAALVAAGAGATVVKHGNRAASGRCGSADLLEAWGVIIDLPPEGVQRCVEQSGIGFCFAPTFHPAMRHAMPARRELGIPTVFNYLGPLTNPAGVTHQTIGVSDPAVADRMAQVLARLGTGHGLVFHSDDGLDELTTTGPSTIWEIKGSELTTWRLDPADLGLARPSLAELLGGEVADNRRIADAVLGGERGAPRDVVALSAGAALYAADRVDSVAEGLEAAFAAIDTGAAHEVLRRWVAVCRQHAPV